MDDVVIRPITDIAGLVAVENLQREVWGMPDRDIVPSHQLLAATSAGGAVLGAFTSAGTLIGFCYGFIGLREGTLLFYSHMAGVTDRYRGKDVGFALKRAQRRTALDCGIDRMVWTFDPLASTNAYFNLHKLGVVARRYYVNYYGEMPDALNRGVESDRLEVDWWLRDTRVAALMRGAQAVPVWPESAPVITAMPRQADPAPGDPELDRTEPALRMEIPTTYTEMKQRDPGLAAAWRAATRTAFQHYFARAYVAVDFSVREQTAGRVGVYLLQHRRTPAPGQSSGEGSP